jgi:hypothetical protein
VVTIEGVAEVVNTPPDDAEDCIPSDEPQLTLAQELFVRCMVEGLTMDECVEKTGRCVRTLYYWRDLPQVARAISRGVQAGLARARSVLAVNAADAAGTLVQLAAAADDPDSARARTGAAKAVLELAVKLGEHFGDAAPTKHEISGTAPISLRIVDPLDEPKPEHEHAGDASGETGTVGDT